MQEAEEQAIGSGLLKGQERVRSFLDRMVKDPPLVLLLEGGSKKEREEAALYWSALLNCSAKVRPCGTCSACTKIFAGSCGDLIFFAGDKKSIKIEDVRNLKRFLGQRPDTLNKRCIVFSQAQALTDSAANGLLKSLEEPKPNNHFLLLVPQRQSLLPTLVSRSVVLTLNWSMEVQEFEDEEIEAWMGCLLEFWKQGTGLFEHSGKKGELDAALVRRIVFALQISLLKCMKGGADAKGAALFFSQGFSPGFWFRLERLLSSALEALEYNVSPSLVLEWIGVQVRQWVSLKK